MGVASLTLTLTRALTPTLTPTLSPTLTLDLTLSPTPSRWEWPLMLRSVLYWVGKSSEHSLTPAANPNPNLNPNPNPIDWVGKSSEYSLTPAEGGGVARIYCIGAPRTPTLTLT